MFWCFAAGFDHMGNAYDTAAAPKATAVAVVPVVAVVVVVRMSPQYNHPNAVPSTRIRDFLAGQGKEPPLWWRNDVCRGRLPKGHLVTITGLFPLPGKGTRNSG